MAAIIAFVVLLLVAAASVPPLSSLEKQKIKLQQKKWEKIAIPFIIIVILALFGDPLFEKFGLLSNESSSEHHRKG